eukprot:2127997-Rhodomonas_salina.1
MLLVSGAGVDGVQEEGRNRRGRAQGAARQVRAAALTPLSRAQKLLAVITSAQNPRSVLGKWCRELEFAQYLSHTDIITIV